MRRPTICLMYITVMALEFTHSLVLLHASHIKSRQYIGQTVGEQKHTTLDKANSRTIHRDKRTNTLFMVLAMARKNTLAGEFEKLVLSDWSVTVFRLSTVTIVVSGPSTIPQRCRVPVARIPVSRVVARVRVANRFIPRGPRTKRATTISGSLQAAAPGWGYWPTTFHTFRLFITRRPIIVIPATWRGARWCPWSTANRWLIPIIHRSSIIAIVVPRGCRRVP